MNTYEITKEATRWVVYWGDIRQGSFPTLKKAQDFVDLYKSLAWKSVDS